MDSSSQVVSRIEEARFHILRANAETVVYIQAQSALLVNRAVPPSLAAFIDSLDPMEADIRWNTYTTFPSLVISLYQEASPIPRRLIAARVGIPKLERTVGYDGRPTYQGETADGFIVQILGYLGACRLEPYTAEVTRNRLVCPHGGTEEETIE